MPVIPAFGETDAGGSLEIPGQTGIHGEFKASMKFKARLSQKQTNKPIKGFFKNKILCATTI